MYNLRYHIASLVAVFFALAVGLILGTVVAERGMITDQAAELVSDLQQRFDEISAENQQLRDGSERDRAFAEEVVPTLTAGNLQGRHVLILVGPEGMADADAAVAALGGTGAATSIARMELAALGLDKAEPEGLAGYFQLRGVEMAPAGDDLERQVAEALVAEWRSPDPRALTEVLVGSGLLRLESTSGTATVDAVVVVGAEQTPADPFAVSVARAMNVSGGVAVGAASAAVENGVPAALSAEGISAVDHLGTPLGRLSFVWLLSSRARGYYGTGEGTIGSYPPIVP